MASVDHWHVFIDGDRRTVHDILTLMIVLQDLCRAGKNFRVVSVKIGTGNG